MKIIIKDFKDNRLARILFVFCLLLTMAAFFLVQKYSKIKNLNRVENQKNSIQLILEKAFAEDVEVVYSIRNLFVTKKNVTREEFSQFVKNPLERHPEILALEWMVKVPHKQRREFEKQIAQSGYPGFQIMGLSSENKIVPSQDRSEYYVVNYLEPIEPNRMAFGYDVAQTPQAKEALEWAKQDGLGVSKLMNLAQGDVGFVVYLPIIENKNFAVGVFRLNLFIQNALINRNMPEVDFILEEEHSKLRFRYNSTTMKLVAINSDELGLPSYAKKLITNGHFTVGKQKLNLIFFPTDKFKPVIPAWIAYFVSFIVLVISVLFVLLFREREGRLKALTATKVREEFLAIASHELKTPLTPLKLEIFMIHKLVDKHIPDEIKKEEIIKLLGNSDRQINHIVKLIDDLLDASRLNEKGQLQLRYSDFNLSFLIKNVANRMESVLRVEGCDLSLNLTKNINVYWDQGRIEQVITNCLSNAIKFAPKQPITITTELKHDKVLIRIKDKGAGIAPHLHKKIFERFERGATDKNVGGLGLGLYIAEQIVLRHGGMIKVESSLGLGAEFIFELPIKAKPS